MDIHATDNRMRTERNRFRRLPNWRKDVLSFDFTGGRRENNCATKECKHDETVFVIQGFPGFNLVCTSCGQRYQDSQLVNKFKALA